MNRLISTAMIRLICSLRLTPLLPAGRAGAGLCHSSPACYRTGMGQRPWRPGGPGFMKIMRSESRFHGGPPPRCGPAWVRRPAMPGAPAEADRKVCRWLVFVADQQKELAHEMGYTCRCRVAFRNGNQLVHRESLIGFRPV